MNKATTSPAPYDWRKTRKAILDRSHRKFVPISHAFIQAPKGSKSRKGPLASLVSSGNVRLLNAYLLIVAITSHVDPNGEWTTALPLQTWARIFGLNMVKDPASESGGRQAVTVESGKTATTRIFRRLKELKLIETERIGKGQNRAVKIRLLREDGSGAPYTRPERSYIRLSYALWPNDGKSNQTGTQQTQNVIENIKMPGLAMLLVFLKEKQPCQLPIEHMPEWYGWSSDTAQRGINELIHLGILGKTQKIIERPLSPTGYTKVNEYTILPPFDKPSIDKAQSSNAKEKHHVQ
ncbi:hypothetical protein OZX67_08485 [Bifidobacterium sp. ESL0728]|uniref:hypothetical protein n=1 Tax=Bifidobacterium sp. ESL0728 TaxID=2983220 RepID=UPI0023F83E5E|nr:hypothetical protein [Bifidobacterium sp. ESL0728]WEV58814.1 hypothetical protein OZX67_08485 [Bifidobacterium sp. ESL0728]